MSGQGPLPDAVSRNAEIVEALASPRRDAEVEAER